jgi:RNA polymerase primary sigma factor
MHSDYKNSAIRQLRDQQVRFAPRDKKIEQVNRAERLLSEIDNERNYPADWLWYKITDFRPEMNQPSVLKGSVAKHDLRLFVEDVSDSANLRAEEVNEPVHTVEDLAKKFNVSEKTISRWRQQGLVSRRFIFGQHKKRVGFLDSSVQRFVNKHTERVKRGEKFSQLDEQQKEEIYDLARKLSRAGACPSDIVRRVAKQVGRSIETVRYTIKSYDHRNPESAIFPQLTGPLSHEAKLQIYDAHAQGVSIDELAKKYRRTRTSIYRVINELRANRIMELPLDYIPNPEFDHPGAETRIMAPMPESETASRKAKPPASLPPYLASLYEVPLLTREQEYHLFRQMNYLKHKAAKLREKLAAGTVRASLMDEIERCYEAANEVKNKIVQANLRLVVSIAKRHASAHDDFFSLVSDGNVSLIRAAEKFDYSRGNKFSTYASWAIMKNFARTIPEEFKHRDRFRTAAEELFHLAPDTHTDQYEQEKAQSVREKQVRSILSALDEREQQIIIRRFGLETDQEPLTLKEVGEEMGVTKERVRQIEARALSKLRQAAQRELIEAPE